MQRQRDKCFANFLQAQFHVPLCLCPEGYGGSPFLDCNPLNSTESALEAVTDIDTEPFHEADQVTESDFQIDTGNAVAIGGDGTARAIVPGERRTESVWQSGIGGAVTENPEQSEHTTANTLAFGENGMELNTATDADVQVATTDSNLASTTSSSDEETPPPIVKTKQFVTEDDSYLLVTTTQRNVQKITTSAMPTTSTTESNVQKITTQGHRASTTSSNVQKVGKYTTTSKPTNVQIITAKSTTTTTKPISAKPSTENALNSGMEGSTETASFTPDDGARNAESATATVENVETTIIGDAPEVKTESTTSTDTRTVHK